MMRPMRVCVWLVEGTWQGCIDAAAPSIPADATVVLLHVTPADVAEAIDAAAAGRLGRAFAADRPTRRVETASGQAASSLLAAAAARLGREDAELLARRGRIEREVVSAVADGVDLLVAARFVVDHAPCAMLLVWPDPPPGVESIPPPPHRHRDPR